MAEVPEVETLVRDLREAVVCRTIRATTVLQPAAVRFPTGEEFTSLLTDRIVLQARRRAKYILLDVSGDLLLAIHLALWGTLALAPTHQLRLPEITVEVLARQLAKRRGVLKTVLLNQRMLAGLANRDADESLWLESIRVAPPPR
jgi:formamidopyrimidine-DNA glycosylase